MAAVLVLTVNAGSSSLKLSLLELGADDPVWASSVAPGDLGDAVKGCGADVVAHRIVHGGERYREAVRLSEDVRAGLESLVHLAPLHQPAALAAIDAVSEVLPGMPGVACFDTSFHASLDAGAYTYALPSEWRARWGLRRYGFHGLSHAYIARRVPELLGRDGLRIVSCHLGSGASLCAISADGRSVDTTMGFTPVEGLVMATRSGSVDPGLLLWLLRETSISADELEHALEKRSGLMGLTGTADMREVLARRAAGDVAAAVAVELYLHRLRGCVAAMTAALGGLDVLVFTGGVGEHAAEVRDEAVAGLGFLGGFETLVVPAREDLEMARQAREVCQR